MISFWQWAADNPSLAALTMVGCTWVICAGIEACIGIVCDAINTQKHGWPPLEIEGIDDEK